jgi:hypothetical protein
LSPNVCVHYTPTTTFIPRTRWAEGKLLSGGQLDPTQHVQTALGDLEREATMLGSNSVSKLFVGLLVGNQRAHI